MANPYFDVLNVYPVETREHTSHELAMAKVGLEKLRANKKYLTEIDMVKAIIDGEGCCDANSALEDALQSSSVYRNWQRSMPYLKDVPNIYGFRTKPRRKNNLCLVDNEIQKIGGFLPKGQVLYRGGKFLPSDFSINDGPISTTTMPSVALWHAREVSGSIAMLRIAENHKARAFAFRTRGNQRLKHEFEILIQNFLKLKHTNSFIYKGMSIYQYDVYVIDKK